MSEVVDAYQLLKMGPPRLEVPLRTGLCWKAKDYVLKRLLMMSTHQARSTIGEAVTEVLISAVTTAHCSAGGARALSDWACFPLPLLHVIIIIIIKGHSLRRACL